LTRQAQAGRNLDQRRKGQQEGHVTAASLRPCLPLPAGLTSAEDCGIYRPHGSEGSEEMAFNYGIH